MFIICKLGTLITRLKVARPQGGRHLWPIMVNKVHKKRRVVEVVQRLSHIASMAEAEGDM